MLFAETLIPMQLKSIITASKAARVFFPVIFITTSVINRQIVPPIFMNTIIQRISYYFNIKSKFITIANNGVAFLVKRHIRDAGCQSIVKVDFVICNQELASQGTTHRKAQARLYLSKSRNMVFKGNIFRIFGTDESVPYIELGQSA